MWQNEQVQKCATCGTFDWEYEEDPDAWQAGIHWCLGCRSLELVREQTIRDREGLPSEGFKLRLYRGGVDDGD